MSDSNKIRWLYSDLYDEDDYEYDLYEIHDWPEYHWDGDDWRLTGDPHIAQSDDEGDDD